MEELRKRADCADVPVIVITAKDLTPRDHKRLNGEVDRIIQKVSPEPNKSSSKCATSTRNATQRRTPEAASLMTKILLVEDNEMNRDMLSRASSAKDLKSSWH
jgi:CheY-like chemotaxis protein